MLKPHVVAVLALIAAAAYLLLRPRGAFAFGGSTLPGTHRPSTATPRPPAGPPPMYPPGTVPPSTPPTVTYRDPSQVSHTGAWAF